MSDETIEEGPRGAWRWWPLRFLAFFILFIALYAGAQLTAIVVPIKVPSLPEPAFMIGAALIGSLLLVLIYRGIIRWIEHRTATELGARSAVSHFIGGAIIGFVLFASVYAMLWAYGAVTFHGWNTNVANGVAAAFVLSLLAGVGEEIIFRGVVYRLFEEGFGTLIAIVLSGAMFGLIHAGNKGATLESSLAIALEAGVLLAAAYVLTRSLWLPIGLHFGWNFTEGGIFGAAVSGNSGKGLLNVTLSGPDLVTGGTFGPEASVAAVGVCLVAAIVMLTLAIQRGQWKPLRFQFKSQNSVQPQALA